MRSVIVILVLMLLIPSCTTSQDATTIIAPAVQRTPQGLQGVLSYITVVTQKGSGHIYIDTWPLAEVDIQGSARLAVQVASDVVSKDWREYDFFITVRSDSPIIGGPSAGGAMTVAVIAALQGWSLTPGVVMSGTINPDETVGPVGGLYQKAQAASEVADTFLIPEGQTTILVEEQEYIRQGPFTYVTTTQKEVNLVEEGRGMGLDVQEIYDIRDAVYYFTGERIEQLQAKGEPIKADFMKPYAQKNIQETRELYETAASTISSYAGSYEKSLEDLLESARDDMESAENSFDQGDYYTSMSTSFVAELDIALAENLYHYLEGQSVEGIFDGLDTYLAQLSEDIRNERPFGMIALQCIAAAQKRIFEAIDYLKEAEDTNSAFEYIEYASYAQKIGKSAEFWLNLSREYQERDEITEPVLKDAASSAMSTAKLNLVYADSVLPQNDLLDEAETALDMSGKEFMDGAYAASVCSALESKVYCEVALITYAQDKSVLPERVDRARERASTAIEASRKRGVEPVLAVSYYELAGTLTNSVKALIYLGFAEEIASIYKYMEAQPEGSPEITPEPQSPEQPEPLPQGKEMLFLGIGACLGVGLCWIVLRMIHR